MNIELVHQTSRIEQHILLLLNELSGGDAVRISSRELSELSGYGRVTVCTSLLRLVKDGILEVVDPGGGRRSKSYRIAPPPEVEDAVCYNGDDTLRRAKDGDPLAFEELLVRHKRLLMDVTAKYAGNADSYDDCLQEAKLSVMTAVETFDPSKGYAFAAYLGRCAARAVIDSLRTQRTLAVPRERIRKHRMVSDAIDILTGELHRPPTTDEIASYVNMKPNYVEMLLQGEARSVSLDDHYDEAELSSVIDEHVLTGDDSVVDVALRMLPEDERDVFAMFIGANGDSCGIDVIAERTGRSIDDVKMLRDRAIRRLQLPKNINALRKIIR